MERKNITCPESAHLEEVEYERTPLGVVINSCSRFEPACNVRCAAECARRMDRADHIRELRERVLIVYAEASRMKSFIEPLATALEADGLIVDRADADTAALPPPEDYDAVVVVAGLRFGGYPRAIDAYVMERVASLREVPSFLVFVNSTGFANGAALHRHTGWQPSRAFGLTWAYPTRIREVALAIADELEAPAA
jgi:hypothetical protein